MYTYHLGGADGQAYHLVESPDLVVVRTKDNQPLKSIQLDSASQKWVSCLVPIGAFPEANVTIYKCLETSKLPPMKVRNQVRAALKEEPGVVFAGRVLRDKRTGVIVVYTENLFVKFLDEVAEKDCLQKLKAYQLKVKEQLAFAKNAYFVCPGEGTGLDIFPLAEKMLQEATVEFCHPELVRVKKNKQLHFMEWHLHPTSIHGTAVDAHVNVVSAWTITKGAGTTIAIIDDGVDTDHPEFAGKVVAPRDTILNVDNAQPKRDTENHGTACAGVACAAGTGKATGVAPEANLLPIRSGGLGSLAEAKAFAWAADHGADVIACSWGPVDGPWWDAGHVLHTTYYAMPDSTRLAIDYAADQGRDGKGCIIVWAAGNGNENIQYDGYASYEKVIAVAACNDTGTRSYYSDYGEAVFCCFPSSDINDPFIPHPKPIAPGIWTTDRRGQVGYNSGGWDAESIVGDAEGLYTARFSGTSAACPGVAGVIALMLSVQPELTRTELLPLLKRACDPIDEAFGQYDARGHSPLYGYGRINAGRAVQQLVDTPDQTASITGLLEWKKNDITALTPDMNTGLDETDRLLLLSLSIEPPVSGLGIRYQACINNLGTTDICQEGEDCGTSDRRRKLIGFRAWLVGPSATDYRIRYELVLDRRASTVLGADGAWAGKKEGKGAAIEGIRIWLEEG